MVPEYDEPWVLFLDERYGVSERYYYGQIARGSRVQLEVVRYGQGDFQLTMRSEENDAFLEAWSSRVAPDFIAKERTHACPNPTESCQRLVEIWHGIRDDGGEGVSMPGVRLTIPPERIGDCASFLLNGGARASCDGDDERFYVGVWMTTRCPARR
jgi:hypothetical protein